MENFREPFDTRLPRLLAAVDAMPGALEEHLPGMTKGKLKSLFQRFSVLLGRLDKSGPRHPQYLYYGSQPLPEHIGAMADQAISYMGNGASTFAQNSMHNLVVLQDLLERAVGTDTDELRRLSTSIAAELSNSVRHAEDQLTQIQKQAQSVAKYAEQHRDTQKQIENSLEQIETTAKQVADIRRNLEQLTNPDNRSRSSIEGLVRRVRSL